MARGVWMRRFARWHIWLGWLVGVPLLLWTASGVVMVLKPIEEVRGDDLRIAQSPRPIPSDAQLIGQLGPNDDVIEVTQRMAGDDLIAILKFADGRESRTTLVRKSAPSVSSGAAHARDIVAREIRGGRHVVAVDFFDAQHSPADFRRPVPAWRVTLDDGTHVYVGSTSGRIEAIRTRWWRFYDFMWGLHIMDLQTREDAHNPFTLVFGILAMLGALLGTVLLFRRRKAKVRAPA